MRGTRRTAADAGQPLRELLQVTPKHVAARYPTGIQLLQWYYSPEPTVGVIETQGGAFGLRIADVNQDGVTALQRQCDAVFKDNDPD